ncbi:hypothetical protein BGW37DRAFT_470958 [Umbelopsis sp. PMI_123]|nr:hypothetical protein BGW37DRAFT_470958 [Umbelopsis sp. PMI_123]
MSVDVPPLDARMDIDEPYELQEVEVPDWCCQYHPEGMDICPPSPKVTPASGGKRAIIPLTRLHRRQGVPARPLSGTSCPGPPVLPLPSLPLMAAPSLPSSSKVTPASGGKRAIIPLTRLHRRQGVPARPLSETSCPALPVLPLPSLPLLAAPSLPSSSLPFRRRRSRSPSLATPSRRLRRRLNPPSDPSMEIAGSVSPPAPLLTNTKTFRRPPLVRSSKGRLNFCPLLPVSVSSPPSSPSVCAANLAAFTSAQRRSPVASSSRESTPPLRSREGTMSPLTYEAQLSPVNGPLSVHVDTVEDGINMVQPLPDLQVLDEGSSQPGSHAVELEENLRPPLAVLEDFVLIDRERLFGLLLITSLYFVPARVALAEKLLELV